jgi:hypothetical protein
MGQVGLMGNKVAPDAASETALPRGNTEEETLWRQREVLTHLLNRHVARLRGGPRYRDAYRDWYDWKQRWENAIRTELDRNAKRLGLR